jgi:ABC-type lipoprotein release transport system permease subunit
MGLTKIITVIVGAALGAALLGVVLGLTVSALIVGVLGLTLLIRRDWVPIVYNLRSLTVRKVTTAVTAAGLALVVFVFAVALMLASGVKETLKATGDPANAKVIRKGAQNEIQSGLLPEHFRLLSSDPGVAIGKDGQPLASAEVVVLIFAARDGGNGSEGSNVTVRGLGAKGLELHGPKNLDGRMWNPGTSEIVIGKGLAGRFPGMVKDGTVKFARRDWKVVGVMDFGGSGFESEIWGDVDQLMDAFGRRPAFSSVTLRMKDKASLEALSNKMGADPQLNTLDIKNEVEYWAAQSENFTMFITFLGMFIAAIFSMGAILGAMITMYAQVAARTREIGTLRAMGFRRRSVLVSFVVESMVLAAVSGGIGLAVASLFQLKTFSTINFQTFSEITFKFHLSAGIVIASMVFAVLMGYAGGLLPAMRASRMPIVQATRGG